MKQHTHTPHGVKIGVGYFQQAFDHKCVNRRNEGVVRTFPIDGEHARVYACAGMTDQEVSRRDKRPLRELNPRMQAFAEALIFGGDDNKPMQLEEAARANGLRLKHARQLMKEGVFRAELARLRDVAKEALKPQAIHELGRQLGVELESPKDTADIRRKAAAIVLHEPGKGVQVNVGIQNTVNQATIIPGYVIRHRAKDEGSQQPLTIEGTKGSES